MAQLILTDEEKASPAYLDWPDETLGKLVKATALTIAEDKNGHQAVFTTTAALLLIRYVVDCGETHNYQSTWCLSPTTCG